MTSNRAHKAAVRQAMNPDEAFTAAARRLNETPAAPPLNRVITAYAYQGGFPHKLHALIDSPATRERMGVGNLVIQGRALCGNRGGSIDYGGWRLVSAPGDNMQLHSGVDFAPEDTGYCQECSIIWREQFQPDSEDTKTCNRCEQDRPLNKFRPHKGRKDGMASECEDCRRGAKKAGELAKEAEQREARLEHKREIAQDWLARVNAWQESPGMTPFRCSEGHQLAAVVGEKSYQVWLSWQCPCGTSPIPQPVFRLIEALGLARRHLEGNPLVVTMT
jgi:hypothetical protein